MCTVSSFIWMYEECSRCTPTWAQAAITRPEQSNAPGPAAPKTYGLPSWAYAYAMTRPTRPDTGGGGGGGGPPPGGGGGRGGAGAAPPGARARLGRGPGRPPRPLLRPAGFPPRVRLRG